MKNILSAVIILSTLVIISSCKKRICDENQTAQLILTNQTLHPIQFYFDGVYMYDMIELTKETLEVNVGTHYFGAKLQGSIFSDTLKWDQVRTFAACEEKEYIFE